MAGTLRSTGIAQILWDVVMDYWAQPNETFLADLLAPRVPVTKEAGFWDREVTEEDDVLLDDGRAPGEAPKEVSAQYETGPVFVTTQRALREPVTYEDHAFWSSELGINRAQVAAQRVARRLLLNREARVTSYFLSCNPLTRVYDASMGVYSNYSTQVVDLSTYNPGSGAGDEQWTDANSDPLDFITVQVEKLLDLGTSPNVVIVPEKLWFVLRRNTAVKAELAEDRDVYAEGTLQREELRDLQVIRYGRRARLSGAATNLFGTNVWVGRLDDSYGPDWRGHVVQPVFNGSATVWPFEGQIEDEYAMDGLTVRIYGAGDPGTRKYYVDVDAGYDGVLQPWNDGSRAGVLLRNAA